MTPLRSRPATDDPRYADPRFAGASRRPRAADAPQARGPLRRTRAEARERARDDVPEAPRTGARRTVLHTIRNMPNYLRLLGGLLFDGRVAVLDKALVGLAIAYIVSPLDLIPDVIPFLGQVDDVFLVVTALQRLVSQARLEVLLDHWRGDPADLDDLSMQEVVTAAAFFLPGSIRQRLGRLVARR